MSCQKSADHVVTRDEQRERKREKEISCVSNDHVGEETVGKKTVQQRGRD